MKYINRILGILLALQLAFSPLEVLAEMPEGDTEPSSSLSGPTDPTEKPVVPELDPQETEETETEPPETEETEETTQGTEEILEPVESEPSETTVPEEPPQTEETEETEVLEEAAVPALFSLGNSLYPGTEEQFSKSGNSTLQSYLSEDGTWHQIYWAQGVTPPSMSGADPFHRFTVLRENGFTSFQAPYEGGHGYYDLNKQETNGLCYLGAGSNLIYWWLDQNSDYVKRYIAEFAKPDGRFSQPGTLVPMLNPAEWGEILVRPQADTNRSVFMSQKLLDAPLVKKAFGKNYLDPSRRHTGGRADRVHDFFFNGYLPYSKGTGNPTNDPASYIPSQEGGFFFPIFGKEKLTEYIGGGGYTMYQEKLRSWFQQGLGVSLSVSSIEGSHAITLWGVEYDDQGNMIRFYVTDTDDYDANVINGAPKYAQALTTYNIQKSAEGDIFLDNRDDPNAGNGSMLLGTYTLSLGRSFWEKAFSDPAPVPQKPVMTLQPESRSYGLSGEADALRAAAKVSSEDQNNWAYLSAQWYEADNEEKDNPRPISGATNWTYTPVLGKSPEKRYYFCRVTTLKYGNTTWEDSDVAVIEVTEAEIIDARPPQLITGYTYNEIRQGDTLTLRMKAKSLDGGSLSYQWYFRDADSTAGDQILEGETGPSLQITAEKTGQLRYRCKVTNVNRTVNGKQTASAIPDAYQIVEVRPGKKDQSPLSITGIPGELRYLGSFTPGYAGGSGSGMVRWTVSGAGSLQEDGSILASDAGNLIIRLTKDGDDTYKPASAEAKITVKKAIPQVGTVQGLSGLTTKTDPGTLVLPHTGGAKGRVVLAGDTVLKAGNHSYSWVFLPEDGVHYEQLTGQVQLNVTLAEKTAVNISALGTRNIYSGTGHLGYQNLKTEPEYGGKLRISYRTKAGEALPSAPKNAGAYQVTLSIPETDPDYQGSLTLDFQILQREITPVSAVLQEKIYDGTRNAVVSSVAYRNLVPGESLTLGTHYAASAAYDSANAGSSRKATVKLKLSDSVKNYVLSTDTLILEKQTIQPKTLNSISLTLPQPKAGETPPKTIQGSHFRGEIRWTPEDPSFRQGVSYEASITLIPDSNHRFTDKTLVNQKTASYSRKDGFLRLSQSFRIPGTAMKRIFLDGVRGIDQMDAIWVDGVKTPVRKENGRPYIELPGLRGIHVAEAFRFSPIQNGDRHTSYPTSMDVYLLKENGSVQELKELQNLLSYCGMSIRITGKRGIRMITGIEEPLKKRLKTEGTQGWVLAEYGTLAAWTHEIPEGAEPVLGLKGVRQNYAYKKGQADPVFARKGSQLQYTNVLVGFTLPQCSKDIALRSYAVFENGAGEKITVYGGTLYRSIGYVAYQNRNAFPAGSNAYQFVWEMIRAAYGNRYDSQYRG